VPALSPAPGPVLAIDTGSSLASIAVRDADGAWHLEVCPQRASSRRLLEMIEAGLRAAALSRFELTGIAAALGPGSFTGLRIGLATALGLHQALSVPATGVPTLAAIAAGAADEQDELTAVVDAMRSACYTQRFSTRPRPRALEPPRLVRVEEVLQAGGSPLAAQDPRFLTQRGPAPGTALLAVGALAAHVGEEALRQEEWNPRLLTRPLYLAPAPVTLPTTGKTA